MLSTHSLAYLWSRSSIDDRMGQAFSRSHTMSYIRDNLMPNEKVHFSATVHPAIFIHPAFFFLIAMGMFVYGFSNSSQAGTASPSTPYVSMTAASGTLMMCFSGMIFLASCVAAIQALIITLTTEFAVTNRRVIAKRGLIRRRTLEILLAKIESVAVGQGILGRLLNFGTITVTGTGGTQESFIAIADPFRTRKKISRIIDHYTQQDQTQQQQQEL
jgi:uncharacterized membrane protein YdbT with pleckstrin-like domain